MISSLLLWSFLALAAAEEKVSGEVFVEKADQLLAWPEGVSQGTIRHYTRDGRTAHFDFKLYVSGTSHLFVFSDRKRGVRLKVLFIERGLDLHVYSPLTGQYVHKTGPDRYESVLNTEFAFEDLSCSGFKRGYTAFNAGKDDHDLSEIRLRPSPPVYGYGMVRIYAGDSFMPDRIEFCDTRAVLRKILRIRKEPVLRMEMADIVTGAGTVLILNPVQEQLPGREFFLPENLCRGN